VFLEDTFRTTFLARHVAASTRYYQREITDFGTSHARVVVVPEQCQQSKLVSLHKSERESVCKVKLVTQGDFVHFVGKTMPFFPCSKNGLVIVQAGCLRLLKM
jgi:hypothetical protein